VFRLTLNSLWSHKRRLVSTCLAVLLGVAFMSGTLVLTSTINNVFDDLFASTNQGTDAIVRGPVLFKDDDRGALRARLPQATVDKVRAVRGVGDASPKLQTADATLLDHLGDPMGGQGPPTFVGSWTADPKLNDYRVAEGRAPRRAGEAVVNRAAAKQGGFRVGRTITVVTARGNERLRLVGLTRFGRADSAGGVISVSTTLRQVQAMTGERGRIDEVDVRSDGTQTREQLVRTLRGAKVIPRANILTGAAAATETANEIKDAFGFFSKILLVFAFIALFVGAFIISNTFGILVAQRTRELALLRAIGSSRRQVLGSVLLEAVLIGVISAVLGFAAGVGLAVGALALLKAVGVDLPSSGIAIAPTSAAAAIVVGVLLTTAAAVIPAIRATRVAPIAALRDVAIDTSGRSRLRAALGVVLIVAGAVLVAPAFGSDPSTDHLRAIGVGMGLLVLAVLALGPIMAKPLAGAVGSPLPLLKGITGRLARQNAMRSPRRTASTAAALIIGVTLIGFITIFASSAQTSISSAIGGGFKGDYIVQPANQQSNTGASPQLSRNLSLLRGVDTVSAASFLGVQLRLPDGDTPTGFVAGIDPQSYQRIFDVKMAQGKLTDLRQGGVIVDRQIAQEHHLAIGQKIKLTSASGRKGTFRIAAIGNDAVLLRSYTLDKADADALTPAPTDFLIGIKLDRATSVEEIRTELRNRVRAYPTMKLQDRDQFTSSIVGQIKALLNVIYGLLAISIIIALIGIANTLSLSVHERTRELGLMRATGMSRSQLRSSVRWEAAIVALMGTVIGIALGVGLSWILVKALVREGITEFSVPIFGLSVWHVGPVPIVALPTGMVGVAFFGLVLGIVASLLPALRAAGLNVLDAISSV